MLIKNDLNSMNTINTINNYKNNENKSMVNSRTNGLSSNVSDRVEISKEAKVLMKEKESEISANTKRIEELRLKIEEGTYNVDSNELAKSMISFIKEYKG